MDLGNTVLIIEHHLDVIKQADWIIDLGPEGGEAGGRIVAQGTPEQVARNKKSYTGQALAPLLALPVPQHAQGSSRYGLEPINPGVHQRQKQMPFVHRLRCGGAARYSEQKTEPFS